MRALLAPIVVVGLLWSSAPSPEPRGNELDARFRAATGEFLAALTKEHRALATFAFDDPLRLDWHFIPRERKGLALGAMSDDERRAAHRLLRSVLTDRGYLRAMGVLELEGVLREIEGNPGRDPGRYFFSVFGDPAAKDSDGAPSPWSLRFEGHHLALNFTGEGDDGVAPTPFFVGANPAEVRSGPRAGFRLLAPHEDDARRLVQSLTPEQRKKCVVSETAPPEVLFGPGKTVDVEKLEGIAYGELSSAQKELFDHVVSDVPGDVATGWSRWVASTHGEALKYADATMHFVWAGGLEPGQGHYWRISSSTNVFEYDNTQNDANHVHLLWRDPKDDFAADWLARHHAAERATTKPTDPTGR
jgi:hypothetical protein